jgi:hypothetical protein
MTVVVLANNDNPSAVPEFDNLRSFPTARWGEILAVVRHVGLCPCVVGGAMMSVLLYGKAAINSVGQFGVGVA